MKANHIRYRYVLGAAVAAIVLTAVMQSTVQAADIKVEVTGSNIRRIEGEGALPVQVIGREEIDQAGVTNAVELMNLISANNSAGKESFSCNAARQSPSTLVYTGLAGLAALSFVRSRRRANKRR